MRFKDFMDLCDNWNGRVKVNDNNLKTIVRGPTSRIMDTRKDLYEKEVVAFGVFGEEIAIRVK